MSERPIPDEEGTESPLVTAPDLLCSQRVLANVERFCARKCARGVTEIIGNYLVQGLSGRPLVSFSLL